MQLFHRRDTLEAALAKIAKRKVIGLVAWLKSRRGDMIKLKSMLS
jgi:hypothetical protein